MSEQNRAVVEMHFADGSKINAWESFALRDTYTDPLGQLDFVARPPREKIEDYRQRLQKGELVTVLVNGASQGGYLIQTRTTTVDQQGVTFKLSCQTPLVTAYQGSVDPNIAKHYQTDTPVSLVVLEALAPYGFTQIVADAAASVSAMTGVGTAGRYEAVSGRKPRVVVEKLRHQDAQAQEGESGYAFCARIFNRLGVCLRMAADGTLLLGAPDYDQAAIGSVFQTFGGPGVGDRLLDGIEIIDTNDNQFAECVVRGCAADGAGRTQMDLPAARVRALSQLGATATAEQLNAFADYLANAGGASGTIPFSKLAASQFNAARPTYQSSVAFHKPLYIRDKNARDADRCRNVAELAVGIRAKDAYIVTGEVDGLVSSTGFVWSVDTVVHAAIEAEGLDEDMWVLERVLTGNRQEGQKTRLRLLPKGALVLGQVPN